LQEVNLVAEVSGKIVGLAPSMASGGIFRKGEVLVTIDPSDYVNAATMAEAEVTQRKVDVLRAREEVTIAREEWNLARRRTGLSAPEADSTLGSLALREPQLKMAEAALKSAEARLEDARTRLNRTQIKSPFNGRVRIKNTEIGQFVGVGQTVGTVYSTDAVEIVVPFQSTQAVLIEGLWTRGRNLNIPATVTTEFGGREYEWKGRVDRTEGMIDATTRTINVVVVVTQPYLQMQPDQPPLLVGMFTTVGVQGLQLDRYFSLPRSALRENDSIWIVENGVLNIRQVNVLQEVDDQVFIDADPSVKPVRGAEGQILETVGLEGNEQVVIGKMDIVSNGMAVRVAP
jgi:RND family efflux transporter MFP subunit